MRPKARGWPIPKRIATALVTFLMVVGFTSFQTIAATKAVAITPQAVIGMPFTGKWAYDANVNPPWSDNNSSHPSVHHTPGGGDWGTDLYAGAGTAVRLLPGYADGTVTFTRVGSSTSCGQSIKLNVNVNGVTVGWVYFAHLSNVSSGSTFYPNDVIGTVFNGSCNPGSHIHVEFKNTTGNYSCYVSHGNPGASVGSGTNLGVLGAPNNGARQECWSVPSAPTPTDSDGDGISDGGDWCPHKWGFSHLHGCPSLPARMGFVATALNYSANGDVPIVGDWDADGDSDFGVVRGTNWILRFPDGHTWSMNFGNGTTATLP